MLPGGQVPAPEGGKLLPRKHPHLAQHRQSSEPELWDRPVEHNEIQHIITVV